MYRITSFSWKKKVISSKWFDFPFDYLIGKYFPLTNFPKILEHQKLLEIFFFWKYFPWSKWSLKVLQLVMNHIVLLIDLWCFHWILYFQLADGLLLEKTSSPLGVLLIIFESRPDALVQVHNTSLNIICIS